MGNYYSKVASIDLTKLSGVVAQVWSLVNLAIGVVLVYAIKSVVENLSKNNSWPDKHGSAPPNGVG